MNEAALDSNILGINEKLASIMGLLSEGKPSGREGLMSKITDLFTDDKREKDRTRRLKQKEKLYQAAPVVIDNISLEGKKAIQKLLGSTASMQLPDKKEDPKRSYWKILGLILAGLISGFIKFVGGYIANFKKAIEGLWRVISGLFKEDGLLTRTWKALKNLFTEEGIFGKAWKWLKGLFAEDGVIGRVIARVRGLFSEESFLGRAIKGLEEFFSSEGPVSKLWQKLKAPFTEEGVIGKFFKDIATLFSEEGFIGRTWNSFKALFTEEGIIGKMFTSIRVAFQEEGIIGRVLGAVGIIKNTLFGWVTKAFEAIKPLFGIFETLFNVITKNPIFRIAEKAFFWVGIILEVGYNLFQSIMEEGATIKGFVDGILGGLLSFVTFGIMTWKDVKTYTDKIVEAWNSGRIIEAILRSLLALPEMLGDALGIAIGKFIGLFSESWGKAIQNFFKENSLTDSVAELWTFIWDAVKNLFKRVFGKDDTEVDKLAATNTRKTAVKPVADLIDNNNRTLISRGQAFSFDKQDQIMAFKSGGPIDNILQSRDERADNSIKQLTVTVQELNKGLQQYFKSAAALQTSEIKIMGENIELLKDIRDKKSGSNVVVQNTANNTSFGDRPSSNLDYRRELTERVTF
jgi:hypothetical protein